MDWTRSCKVLESLAKASVFYFSLWFLNPNKFDFSGEVLWLLFILSCWLCFYGTKSNREANNFRSIFFALCSFLLYYRQTYDKTRKHLKCFLLFSCVLRVVLPSLLSWHLGFIDIQGSIWWQGGFEGDLLSRISWKKKLKRLEAMILCSSMNKDRNRRPHLSVYITMFCAENMQLLYG